VSRSFGKKVENFQELKESIAAHCLNASEKIRSESLLTKSITVFIRTSPFQNKGKYYSNSKTIDFPIATDNSLEIVKTALIALDYIFKEGFRYQKSGIILSGLSNAENNENLFYSVKENKIKNLMKSIDYTNNKYGRSTLSLADAGFRKKSNLRREYSSKIDTADFYCLPTVRAI
jgi:DNA polymerase V